MLYDSNGILWNGTPSNGGTNRFSGNDTDYDESSSVELAIIAGCIGR